VGNSILQTVFVSRRRNERNTQLARVVQLVAEQEFARAAQLLAPDRRNAYPEAVTALLDTIRDLCVSGADHARLASELAATATGHERAAQDIRQRILGLLKAQPGSQATERSDPAAETAETAEAAAAAAADTVEVTAAVLGPFEVRIRGKRVSGWGGQKNRTLFQYLLLHPERPVHREVLMELLWPGYSYTSARNNLNVCIYGVRQALRVGSPAHRFILYRDSCYILDPDVTWRVDRSRFVSLVNAAREASAQETRRAIDLYLDASRLYRGPLFEDDLNCDWFASERRMLHELYLQSLGELGDLYLAARDFGAATETARRVLDEDVCRESAHRLLMRCYSLQSQRSLVARQFQQCIDALQREFSLSPTDETVSLFHALTAN
jgi:DNA-binding SARP family transcriptional activator